MTAARHVSISLLLLLFSLALRGASPFVINEFVASNGGDLRDEDGDTPDWIEIRNATTNSLDIGGWHLTDTITNLAQWTFPSTVIPAGGYLLVFASEKDRATSGRELHTNFALDERGEYLGLVEPDGKTVADGFLLVYPKQHSNVSFGRESSMRAFLSLDFNDDDSGETGSANTQPGFYPVTLSTNPTNILGVTVSIGALGSTTLDDRDRVAPLSGAGMTQSELYDDYIYATGTANGNGLQVRLSGLPPNRDFTLKVWSTDPEGSTVGDRISQWVETARGTAQILQNAYSFNVTVRPTSDDRDTFTAPVRTSANGELQIEARRTGGVSTGVYLNALQLLEAAEQTSTDLKYFKPPTPGAPNGNGFAGVVGDTHFSVDRGIYEQPFEVAITCETPGAAIYWTTNSNIPDPVNGTVYTGPVAIQRTTLLRAAAYLKDFIPSDVDTHTYIFIPQVLRQSATQPGYPTTWQASYPADYGMDPVVVDHPKYGLTISNDLQALPIVSVVTPFDGLWGSANGIYNHSTTVGWERSASVELFQSNRTEFAINCGIEMQGNASRDNVRTPKHSMRLSFKGQYGSTKLSYDWFKAPVSEFDTIVLRALGFVDGWPTRYSDTTLIPGTTQIGMRYRPENATYLRDAWMKASFRDMGHLTARSDFAHLYLNGLYWGLYNPSERLDASFFASHLGGRTGDWDVMAGDDTYDFAEVRDGTKDDWNALLGLVNGGVYDAGTYQRVGELVDLVNLADYMILHMFAEAEDWPFHNWYAAHRRATNGYPSTKWIFTVWDQEIGLDRLVRRDRVDVSNNDTPARIYSQLRAWPEFRLLFADRVQKHLFHGGALTPERNVARFEALAKKIERALVGESARWGDAREFTIGANPGTGKTFTPDEWWRPELDRLYTSYFPTLNDTNIARFKARGLYPGVPAPRFSQNGGSVPQGFTLTIQNPVNPGSIYYTVDSQDPRSADSGAPSASALVYSEPVPIGRTMVVRARTLIGTDWSAMTEAFFYPPQDLSALAITEIMYNAVALGATNGEEFEFIELKNFSDKPLDLSGLTFSQGVSYEFPQGSILQPGKYYVVAANAGAFETRYGKPADGAFAGHLSNGGEKIALAASNGSSVFTINYSDVPPWPTAADGHGFSIVPRHPGETSSPDSGEKWRASAYVGGSPGQEDPDPGIPPIVINEILAHVTPPAEEAVELHNPGSSSVDVSGWTLTDDRQDPWKFIIPAGTVIPAHGYVVVSGGQFKYNGVSGFGLSSLGEELYLFSATPERRLTGYSWPLKFGATWNGVSLGLEREGEQAFYVLQKAVSLGEANPGPRVGPVVITEIHYHPPAGDDEFVEIQNITNEKVRMLDPAFPTNTWRVSGLGFRFPENFELVPGGMAVITVATNAAEFRQRWDVPESVAVFAAAPGRLQDGGENVELQAPDAPSTNGIVPMVTVDQVRYNDQAPWPASADGTGLSLQRVNPSSYGNTAMNWRPASPTPGRLQDDVDSDKDGMPDTWEMANGTNPLLDDAQADPDRDGMANLQEFMAGTSPVDPSSRLALEGALEQGDKLRLTFQAVAGRTYSLLYKGEAGSSWEPIKNFAPQPASAQVSFEVPMPGDRAGFYRISTP